MDRPLPAFGGSASPPAIQPSSTVTSYLPQFQPSVQHTAPEPLMTSAGLHTVPAEQSFSPLTMNIGSLSPGYSPPAISPIQHQTMFPPVAPFPPPYVRSPQPRGVFSLMRRFPSVLPSPSTFSGTYRLSHPLTSHPQSSVSWVTQSQTPPVYPFAPPGPHLPHSPPPCAQHLPHSPLLPHLSPAAQSFSHLSPGPEFVFSSPGCYGPVHFPYTQAAVHGMQSPMQQMGQEMYFYDPGFVAAETQPQQLSHTVATLQYPPQLPSCTSRYTGTRMVGHQQQQQQMRGTTAGHARDPQIARPIPVYRHPAPAFGAASILRGSCSTPVPIGVLHHQVRPQIQLSAEGSTFKSTVSVPQPMQMPYVICEESESPTDSPQMQVTPLAAASGQDVEASTQEGTTENPSEAKKQGDAKELEEYKEFAAAFKAHRLRMGYSQVDVVQQVSIRYGVSFSQVRIGHFEDLQLTITSVRSLKPTLEQWVRDTAKASGTSEEEIKEIIVSPSTSINPRRERKRRTSVDACIKYELETEFQKKLKPTKVEMGRMASRLRVDKEFVRIWFCNRRQRQKKKEKESQVTAAAFQSPSGVVDPPRTIKIPSPSHDITVEVPGREGQVGSGQAAVYIT